MWQLLASFARRVQERARPVRLLLNPGFGWMNDAWGPVTDYSFSSQRTGSNLRKALAFLWLNPWRLKRSFQNHPPAAVLLVSWHPLNFLVARLAKFIYPDIPVITWLHEPYKDEKGVYGVKALIIWLVELCQTLSLWYTDVVILHSRRGLRLFEKRYPNFQGIKRVVPLQFQDDGFDAEIPRRYISFLGRADRAKGIEEFFQLVEEGAKEQLNCDFQIITGSDIQPYLKRLSAAAFRKLRVVYRPQLSDQELRDGAANSLALMALYRETMQSGVIPLALMKGTPIIGTNIEGITEWVRDRETGVIVSNKPAMEELLAAIVYVQDHLEDMTVRCRSHYLATFDDRNWDEHYGWLRSIIL